MSRIQEYDSKCTTELKSYLVCFAESDFGSREAEVDSAFVATQLDVAALPGAELTGRVENG